MPTPKTANPVPTQTQLTKLEKYLLSMYAYTQRDVREMHAAVQVLVTAGLLEDEEYSEAVNLVSCSRPRRNSIEKTEELILIQFSQTVIT